MHRKAILIDDEPLARFELKRLLRGHPDIEVVGEAEDGAGALELLRETRPDVMFLDIEMPGMGGFELLEAIPDATPDVIFTTAYDQHALRAFEVNALDYLLKPIVPARLAAAIERLGARQPAQVFVRDGKRCWMVRLVEISLLESEGNYTRLHFRGERPLIHRSLTSIEQQWSTDLFFRANRRQLMNLSWIAATALRADGGLAIDLRCGARVEVSRRRGEELRARLSL